MAGCRSRNIKSKSDYLSKNSIKKMKRLLSWPKRSACGRDPNHRSSITTFFPVVSVQTTSKTCAPRHATPRTLRTCESSNIYLSSSPIFLLLQLSLSIGLSRGAVWRSSGSHHHLISAERYRLEVLGGHCTRRFRRCCFFVVLLAAYQSQDHQQQ